MTALLGLSCVWADLNVVTPDLNTVDVAEARDGQFVSTEYIRNTRVKTVPDHGHGHGHAHAHDNAHSLAVKSDPTVAGYYNQYYDPAYAQQNYYQKYDVAKIKRKGLVHISSLFQLSGLH